MKRQYSLILAVSFMIFYNVASGLYYSDCGSEHGKLKYFSVEGCETDCKLKIEKEFKIIVGFTVSERADEVEANTYAKQRNGSFTLGSLHACNDANLKCPLERGSNYKFQGAFYARSGTPTVRSLVSWILSDQTNRTIICVNFNATIV